MIVMWFGWIIARRLTKQVTGSDNTSTNRGVNGALDIVNLQTVDLTTDEYQDVFEDDEEEALRRKRISQGKRRLFWRVYYLAA
jgi:hypothetical protein